MTGVNTVTLKDQARAAEDRITILTSAGPRLTKVWDSQTGKPKAYDKVREVAVQERAVCGIHELAALLDELEGKRSTCIIRGKFIGKAAAAELYAAEIERHNAKLAPGAAPLTVPKEGYTLRRLTFFKDRPLHFFYIDIDSFKPTGGVDPVTDPEGAIAQYVAAKLPACFQGISYHWQLSSGAGHPANPGVLKAHVAFWLRDPHMGDDLELWVKAQGYEIDVSVFRTVQPNYTAAPLFINGVVDPVPRRSGLCEGFLGDSVDLVIDPVLLLRAKTERKSRQDIKDPRDKDNHVGLFCRTFEIEEVVERWLSGVFEFVTEWRMNWLQGGGAGEGAGVTDNRQGIFNTHNTDPFLGRAANKWDLVRHYVFGHLDAGLDAFELMDIRDKPSELAMREMVRGLPEMREEVVTAVDTHRAALTAAADEAALRAVAGVIAADTSVDRLGRDLLAPILQARLLAVTGARPGMPAVKALLAPPRVVNREVTVRQGGGGPEWAQPWVYVTGQAKFFNMRSKALITREAFDAAHCRFMEPDEDGQIASAAKVACDNWQIPVVDGLMYLPSVGETFEVDGRNYVNLYRPESVPLSMGDAVAFGVLMRHFELTVPNGSYRAVLLRWAAWIVRNPGLKVLWSVLIKGVEGDGKSLIGNMLGQAMGYENVGIISPETLAGSNFNDWAVGRCVNVIEELKMPGHNKHDAYNKIKPLITNPRIEVHGKGKASMTAVNTTNYLAFTNHGDALPLDDKDRRNFILFTPWRDISEMHAAIAAIGLTVDQYWDEVWAVVKTQPEVVRAFFESIDITGFDPNSRAPASEFKDRMVQAGDLDDAEAYAKFYIDEGCYGVSRDVVSSACLTRALLAMDPPVQIHTSRVSRLLEGMGFEKVAKPIKWAGATHRVWVTGGQVTGEVTCELRKLLDATVVEDFLK